MHSKFIFTVIGASLILSGCNTSLFDVDSDIVNTPIHDDSKVFYLDTSGNERATGGMSQVPLFRPFERADDEGLEKLKVANGDPVSIVVNKVVLPRYLFDTLPTHSRDSKTYDIAVILDVAVKEGVDTESIAVFYQRGVKANTALAFQNLLVYSQDTWDNRVPPWFRIRIFNVANERNERTKEALEQIYNLSGSISTIIGSPLSDPLIQVAARAAELVTLGDNEMLVDFQFQLYSNAQVSQSGGMPLGYFLRGGLALVGIPRGEERQFWRGRELAYSFETEEVLETQGGSSTPLDVPFLLATVITTDTVVPNVVKQRSAEIFKILQNDAALRTDISRVTDSVTRLATALKAMEAREEFATNPTPSNFRDFLAQVKSSTVGTGPDELSQDLSNWLLATARSTVGLRFSNIADYVSWFNECGNTVAFNSEERKFETEDLDDTDRCNQENTPPAPLPPQSPAPAPTPDTSTQDAGEPQDGEVDPEPEDPQPQPAGD